MAEDWMHLQLGMRLQLGILRCIHNAVVAATLPSPSHFYKINQNQTFLVVLALWIHGGEKQ